jgi:hypothetical protein
MLFDLARVRLMLGDHDEAVDHLETVVNVPSRYSRALLRVHPFFNPLRDNDRFRRLISEPEAVFPQ